MGTKDNQCPPGILIYTTTIILVAREYSITEGVHSTIDYRVVSYYYDSTRHTLLVVYRSKLVGR